MKRQVTFGVHRLCPACVKHPGVEHAWHNGEAKGHEPPPRISCTHPCRRCGGSGLIR